MKSLPTRRFVPSALLAAALLAVSSAAVAAPPPVVPDLDLDPVPAGQGCDFELGITGTGAKARIKTFENGRQIISGKGYLLTYTNLETGTSVTFPTNGTAQRTSAPDANNVVTVTATGSNGLVLFPSDESEVPGVGTPSAIQYTGRIVYTIDLDTGVFTLLSASGRQRDLCAELA
jgi:hypothetical protein